MKDLQDRINVAEQSDGSLLLSPDPTPVSVPIGSSGAQGEQGPAGSNFEKGLLADRPGSPTEGSVYYATDTNQFSVFFQ